MNLVEYKRTIGEMTDTGDLALPENVSPEAFRNAAVVAYTDNPKIASCAPETVFKALRRLASMGLVPDGREAALVPFKTKVGNNYVDVCQAMPMIGGLIKMARNSAEVTDLRAHIVFQNEVDDGRFTYHIGDEERLTHEPILFGDKGPAVACYAIARLKDGTIMREFMDAEQIDKVRRSGASQKIFERGKRPVASDTPVGIWAEWWDQMWIKTVIRRLSKRLPISAEDKRHIVESEPEEFQMKDVTPRRQSLEDRIAAQQEDQRPEVEPEDVSQDIVEGEIVLTAMPQNGFPGDEAFDQGQQAYNDESAYQDNPYVAGDAADQGKADSWAAGWNKGHEAAA